MLVAIYKSSTIYVDDIVGAPTPAKIPLPLTPWGPVAPCSPVAPWGPGTGNWPILNHCRGSPSTNGLVKMYNVYGGWVPIA